MTQMLLFPDPRPLVDRLGLDFFRQAPAAPGVYLMRDGLDAVLYVGKAKDLRKRLASYRVANPDRMRRRQLRLLRAVQRIELQACDSEAAALAREATLLSNLRPQFNRAGTWPGRTWIIRWRITDERFELAVAQTADREWKMSRCLGANAPRLCAVLARLFWFGLHPNTGANRLPQGWFSYPRRACWEIPRRMCERKELDGIDALLDDLFSGEPDRFADWIRARTVGWTHLFDIAAREAELEALAELTRGIARRKPEHFLESI